MKKHLSLFIFVINMFAVHISWSQDIELSSQADVDAFDQSITDISGYLIIEGNDITDLSNLSNITSVGGHLQISSNDALVNLDGLSNITSVGGYIEISYNDALVNLDGLSKITSVGEDLIISSNVALVNLDGLSNLTSVGGDLFIAYNDALVDLDGLSNLTSVGGGLYISRNDALVNLDGLSNITSIGYLTIYSNDALVNLDGLSNLTSVGRLSISSNDALVNLDGLSNITSVGGDLKISDNDALVNLDGLSNITSVGGYLTISSNFALVNLDGLSNITSVGGDIEIYSNDALENLDGLSKITSVGGDLYISNNSSLTNCCGIQRLLSTSGAIAGSVSIYSNPSECSSEQEILESCNITPSFLQEGNQWIYEYTEVIVPSLYDQTIETITVIGDTLINSYTYAILYATEPSPCGINGTYEYLREDGDKIYRLNRAKNQEYLMIDFAETDSYIMYFENGNMGNDIDTATVMIDSFGIDVLPDGKAIEVQYSHIINNQSYDDETVYKVYKNIGFVQPGLLFPDLGTGLCDPYPGTHVELRCHISDDTLHFTQLDCDQLDLYCTNIIPKEKVFCVADVKLDSTILIDNIYITSGTEPYTYSWSCDYVSQLGIQYPASSFLQDTTVLKPVISHFITVNEPILFHLTITDATGLSCTNDLEVIFSEFVYTLGYVVPVINQGDSISLGGSGVGGGIPPLSYFVVPDYNVTDPMDPFSYVSPDTSTSYAIYAIDSAGCISNPNKVMEIIVIPTSTENILASTISYQLYPNPVNEELHLTISSIDNFKDISINIFDNKGRRIVTKSIILNHSIIDSNSWIPGIYYYELSTDNKVLATGKILK